MIGTAREYNAVGYVFGAIKQFEPSLLEDLRARRRQGSRDVAKAWSAAHSLDSPRVRAYVSEILQRWKDHPVEETSLRVQFGVALTGVYRELSAAESAWLVNLRDPNNHYAIPDPFRQSLRQWLRLATGLYREREALIYGGKKRPRRPPVIRDHSQKHCEWFVQTHVLGVRATDVARSERDPVTPKAVKTATKNVAALLGIRIVRK